MIERACVLVVLSLVSTASAEEGDAVTRYCEHRVGPIGEADRETASAVCRKRIRAVLARSTANDEEGALAELLALDDLLERRAQPPVLAVETSQIASQLERCNAVFREQVDTVVAEVRDRCRAASKPQRSRRASTHRPVAPAPHEPGPPPSAAPAPPTRSLTSESRNLMDPF